MRGEIMNYKKGITTIISCLLSSLVAINANAKDISFVSKEATETDNIVYQEDGEALNWNVYHKPELDDYVTEEECEKADQDRSANECFKLNPDKMFNDKKWRKNKYLKPVKGIISDLEEQINSMSAETSPYRSSINHVDIPESFNPWWSRLVAKPISDINQPLNESLHSLISRAIAHSAQIRVFSDVPIIRETAIYEAKGKFDLTGYVESRWRDIDDPVGSTLTTGGDGRFLEDEWMHRVGMKKKFITGTEVDVSKRWGVLDNNSEFLVPNNQASTRWAVTLTQPLLRGFGVKYNRSNITVAKIDSHIALDEYKRQIESHLLEVVRAYWGLYLERASLLQQRKLVNASQKLYTSIKKRRNYDVSISQVRNARAKLLERQAALVRVESAVRNAEEKILSLVNDPSLIRTDNFEIIPSNTPIVNPKSMSAGLAVTLAMANRPEIAQTFKQLKAGAVRAQITRNELRPVLNLMVKYYRDGIAGDADTSLASDLALDEGDGSWELGVVFEYPFSNTTQKSRHRRKKAELRQLINQMRTTVQTVILEVKVSVREVNTALRKMNAQYAVLQSANTNLKTLEKRQSVDLADGKNGAIFLEDLLDAQDDVTIAEYEFLRSQIGYNIALANLDRATGMLLQTTQVQPRRYQSDDWYDLPRFEIEPVEYR